MIKPQLIFYGQIVIEQHMLFKHQFPRCGKYDGCMIALVLNNVCLDKCGYRHDEKSPGIGVRL